MTCHYVSIVTAQQTQNDTDVGPRWVVTPHVFARTNGSPYYPTKIVDLRPLKYSRYLDATATHRLRGPEDVVRYAALVTGAEILYAIGMYLMSLEPPTNPTFESRDVLARGEQIFRQEGCVNCHVPPAYTNGKLTLALGWQPPPDHPNQADIVNLSVGTDPGLALKTRKGTGLYKVPSLRGVWARPLLLHDGSVTSLEEMFDPQRLKFDYEPKGWNLPGVTKRAVPGHGFGLMLSADEKRALLAFLRSL